MQATLSSNESIENKSFPTARILVIDDQLQVAEFLVEMLNLVGYGAVAEANPQRALERIEDESFDVVISDFKMPEMSGCEFFHAATELRPALAKRFIFLTGDLFNQQTEVTLAALGVPCLGKPFKLATVEQVVGDVLAKNPVAS